MAYELDAAGQVRLTISDSGDSPVFEDHEIGAFLAMAKGNVDRAAARALDVIASDEALTSKYIRTQDLSTDGPKVAAALREHAKQLRAEADRDDDAADEGYFDVIDFDTDPCRAERTQHLLGF